MADALLVPLERVSARRYRVAAPDPAAYPGYLRDFACKGPVEGWLVGASDGRRWGWWGPVPWRVASDAEALFGALDRPSPTTPGDWGRRLRRSVRHGHSGLLGIAAGAIELACWDLTGQRNQEPVWAFHASRPTRPRMDGYATCFGVKPDHPRARSIASEVASDWSVQKWRPPQGGAAARQVEHLARSAGGEGVLALDFGGTWRPCAVRALSEGAGASLAWLEEPYAPDEMHLSRRGDFRAPHAAGEHCYGPVEAAILVAAGVDIWQPDALFCGGYSQLRIMAALALSEGARCVPHGGGLLPSLHAAAAGSTIEMVEYHLLVEPRRQAHLAEPLRPFPGPGIPVPERPGWAGTLSRQVLGGHDE